MRIWSVVLAIAIVAGGAGHLRAGGLRMAVTTSFHNSGLSDILLPQIRKDIGVDVHLLVLGTGQALKVGRSGDVDAVLVHSRQAEETFVAKGFATHRREIMYNDFVIIGPAHDPAAVAASTSAADALASIRAVQALFVSRGDDSGTHRKERAVWEMTTAGGGEFDHAWYRAAGAGMGATLNTASGLGAYVMADRASWLKFKNKADLKLLFAGDPVLFNQYAYLPINPALHAHVKSDLSTKLEDWLVSARGQALIGTYRIDGERLFTPNATSE